MGIVANIHLAVIHSPSWYVTASYSRWTSDKSVYSCSSSIFLIQVELSVLSAERICRGSLPNVNEKEMANSPFMSKITPDTDWEECVRPQHEECHQAYWHQRFCNLCPAFLHTFLWWLSRGPIRAARYVPLIVYKPSSIFFLWVCVFFPLPIQLKPSYNVGETTQCAISLSTSIVLLCFVCPWTYSAIRKCIEYAQTEGSRLAVHIFIFTVITLLHVECNRSENGEFMACVGGSVWNLLMLTCKALHGLGP